MAEKDLPSEYHVGSRRELAEFLPAEYSRALEIGCGEGSFIQNLTSKCEYWGIEPNSVAAEKASQKLHKVLIGKYEDVRDQIPDGYFDLIICNDVIEHIEKTDEFLEWLRSKMSPNGVLIGSIPNVRYIFLLFELLARKDWKYKDHGILDRTHLRFFTKKSIRRILSEHQFEIVKLKGVNSALIPKWKADIVVSNIALILINVLTLGYYNDIQYLQFGFQVKPKTAGPGK